jgi:hypothetical protein
MPSQKKRPETRNQFVTPERTKLRQVLGVASAVDETARGGDSPEPHFFMKRHSVP